MVVTGGTFVLMQQRADARTQVLAVARPVAAGQVLAAEDVRVVRIVPAPELGTVAASESSTVIGRAAAVPLVAGSLLSRAEIGPAAWPAEGQVVVAVPVKTSRLADGVAAGSHVLVMEVAKDDTPSGSTGRAPSSPVDAVVVSVRPGADGTGTATISLLLGQQDAVAVAGSAADLSVALARG